MIRRLSERSWIIYGGSSRLTILLDFEDFDFDTLGKLAREYAKYEIKEGIKKSEGVQDEDSDRQPGK